jgi:hypothetical protein
MWLCVSCISYMSCVWISIAMDTHWRLLFDPIRFLQFLRVLMNERINHLSDISQAINKYWGISIALACPSY